MDFELSILIKRPPAEVFEFLRDKDRHHQEEGSPVLVLEKITPGPPGVGTRYREVVQMLPLYRGEILSKITNFKPYELLEEDFSGAGMHGHLAYQFIPENSGTKLVQLETLHYHGALRFLEPLIRIILAQKLRERLEKIKACLELIP